MRPGSPILLAAIASLMVTAVAATAQDTPVQKSLTVRTSVKTTGLIARQPDAPELFPSRTAGQSMVRLRIEPEIRASQNVTVNLAYEQRLHYLSAPTGATAIGILPSAVAPPFRLKPLVWRVGEVRAHTSWRHEIDRANVQLQGQRAALVAGRQAIGWGRGVMFTSVDLFAPFSPLEVDREWRAGVDAIRTDIKLTDRSSIDLVAALGDTADASAFVARARGYAGVADVEVVGGRRAQDLFTGVSTSAAVGDAEVHGEAAVFRTPSLLNRGDSQAIWKVVAGGSYRLPVGSGILVYAEYHYSGFGAAQPEAILALVATPSFIERLVRGDMQILSRHAIGTTASYEASPELTYSGQWLLNPGDGSGVVAPALTYTFNDAVSLLGAVYLPYGRPPAGGVLRSEYGAAAMSGLLQLRWYF